MYSVAWPRVQLLCNDCQRVRAYGQIAAVPVFSIIASFQSSFEELSYFKSQFSGQD